LMAPPLVQNQVLKPAVATGPANVSDSFKIRNFKNNHYLRTTHLQ